MRRSLVRYTINSFSTIANAWSLKFLSSRLTLECLLNNHGYNHVSPMLLLFVWLLEILFTSLYFYIVAQIHPKETLGTFVIRISKAVSCDRNMIAIFNLMTDTFSCRKLVFRCPAEIVCTVSKKFKISRLFLQALADLRKS